jgi:hypothetical protein
MPPKGARAPKDAVQVDIHHPKPIGIAYILRLDPVFAHAGIVDTDRGRRAARGQIVSTGRHAGGVAHVARYCGARRL